jgi:hypothetical protein
MGRACSKNGKKRNAYRMLVGKPEETLGRPRRRWVGLREIELGGMDWIDLADRDQWRALANTILNLRVP